MVSMPTCSNVARIQNASSWPGKYIMNSVSVNQQMQLNCLVFNSATVRLPRPQRQRERHLARRQAASRSSRYKQQNTLSKLLPRADGGLHFITGPLLPRNNLTRRATMLFIDWQYPIDGAYNAKARNTLRRLPHDSVPMPSLRMTFQRL